MKKIIVLIIFSGLFIGFNSCKKKPDEPPVKNHLGVRYYGVPELKALATSTNPSVREFTEDHYFAGVVLADHVSGNFYKEIYVRDRYNTGAIRLDLLSSACNFFIGDSIRLNLKGYDVNLNVDTKMLEIDSIDCEKAMVKFASGPAPQPIAVSLAAGTYTNYLCELVMINNIAFTPFNKNKIWADAILGNSGDRAIKDCSGIGDSIIVRTSNYADFAGQKTPTGIGTIIGIATAYKGKMQMAIRTPNELSMNGTICNSSFYLSKDFNDNSMTSGGWTQASVVGPTITWGIGTFSGDIFAKISGYVNPNNIASENWLVSPAMDLTASTNPVLTFITMANYTGNLLEVKVSTNYTTGNPNSATWTNLSGVTLSSTGWVVTPSGNVSLSAFKTSNVRIAFKYTSTSTASKTYEVDDIIVKEN